MDKINSITVFNYEDTDIAFKAYDGTAMINATQMAKPFNKRVVKWLELPSTQEFLQSLSEVRKSDITQLVVTRRGNFADKREQGTWMHEDVALEFARWLSPMFAIWCNDRIKELLTTGSVSIQPAQRPAESLESVFSESKRVADQMRQELTYGKALPVPNVTLTAYDVAIYAYLRNGIKSVGDIPFCVTDIMVSKALGIDIEDVKAGWERLEKGAFIVRRKFGDYYSFILGKRQP